MVGGCLAIVLTAARYALDSTILALNNKNGPVGLYARPQQRMCRYGGQHSKRSKLRRLYSTAFADVTEPRRTRSRDAGSRPFGDDPSRKNLMNASPGALGKGARRHEHAGVTITASFPGAALNRSRRGTRSRAPLRVAMFTLLPCGFSYRMDVGRDHRDVIGSKIAPAIPIGSRAFVEDFARI